VAGAGRGPGFAGRRAELKTAVGAGAPRAAPARLRAARASLEGEGRPAGGGKS
jgi:hypothetical protein